MYSSCYFYNSKYCQNSFKKSNYSFINILIGVDIYIFYIKFEWIYENGGFFGLLSDGFKIFKDFVKLL